MPSKFGGLPVLEADETPPPSRFGGVPASVPKSKFGGIPTAGKSKFGGVPVDEPISSDPSIEAPKVIAPLPMSPDERQVANTPIYGPADPMRQENEIPVPPGQGTPSQFNPPKPGADNIISAAGKAIQNAVPRWQSQLGALTQAVGEKFIEIVNTPLSPEDEAMIDPAARQAFGEAAAKLSLKGQLERRIAQEKIKTPNVEPGSIEYYTSSIIGSVAEMAPGMAASLLLKNPLPAMALIGAQSGGNAYGEARDLGLDPKTAREYAGLYAIAEGIPEALPVGLLLHGGKSVLGQIVKGALGEGATEAFTEALQAGIDKGYIDPNMTWGEVWPRIKDAAIIGTGAGGIVGAASEVTGKSAAALTKGATDVSESIFGRGAKWFKNAADAEAFRKSLAGKKLDERVAAWAQKRDEFEKESQKSTPPSDEVTPAAVLRKFEGLILTPRWDVNADRVGFGSDTITDENGKVRRVQPGDRITEADAERDLNRRLNTEFIPSIKAEVGTAAWEALEPAAQAALASVTYNYGNLPNNVAAAVRTGDTEAIAEAIEDLAGHNDGINAGRRMTEAALVRGEDVDLTPGKAITGSPRKQLTAYLDLADRTLNKLAGSLGEESIARSSRRMNQDMMGNDESPDMGRRLAVRQERAGFQSTDEQGRLRFLVARIREITSELGDAIPANRVAAVQKRLTSALEQLAPPSAASSEEDDANAPQAPFEGPPPVSRETIVSTPVGDQRIRVRYEVVDAADLKKATGDLQPRDRSKIGSAAQIEEIAAKLRPEDLIDNPQTDRGAPVVGPDGVVESGNGRRAALIRAAEAYPERFEAYKAALRAEGFEVPDTGVPILIRRRVSDLTPEQRIDFARNSNRDNKLAMSPAEVATLDAKGMNTETLRAFKGGSPADPANADFVARFSKGLTTEEAGALTGKDGRLNAEGAKRLRQAVFAAAYGDTDIIERFTESNDDNVKAITGAMADVAGEWAVMRREIASGETEAIDPTPHLLEAVNLLSTARETAARESTPIHAEIARAIDQLDLMTGKSVAEETRAYVEGFYQDTTFKKAEGRDTLATWLKAIVRETRASAATMFGPSGSTPEEIARAAKPKVEQRQGSLLSSARRPAARGEVDGERDGGSQVLEARGEPEKSAYPIAPRDEWYSDADYAARGGRIVQMTPDEFLEQVKPLDIDEVSRENIDDLKQHIKSGKTLDPLKIYADGKEDGRHRAVAAKELGIKSVPVIDFRAETPETFNLKFNPGPKWIPDLSHAMPARQVSVLTSTGQLEIPAKPTIRDEPRKKLLAVIGERLYQGKVRGKTRAGFYRTSNSEIRIKRFDDIEVQAHEAAHFLEFHHTFKQRFKALRQRFRAELDPLSYTQDPKVIGEEGFAEYVRLWATQYAKARKAAPQFTAAFEAELKKAGLWNKMTAFQEAAHRWYYQGELAQFRGKSGESADPFDTLAAFMRQHPVARFIQGAIDPAYGAKLIERQIYGKIHSAERSAYKLTRLTRGGESMLEAAIEDGALELKPDGSYGTVGKSLKDIFFPAAKHGWERFDELMEYFKARRAEELTSQGRENLFTRKEISAGLDLANQHPEFKTIFEEWLAFNDQMLTFFTDMGVITNETATAIRKGNKAYVPFFRIRHQIEGEANVRGNASKVGKTLRGGERNTGEIFENILDGLYANIQAALTSRARARLFEDIHGSQEGSEFAVEIPAGSKQLKVAQDQMSQRLAEILIDLGVPVVLPGGMVIGPPTGTPVDVSDIDALLQRYPELAIFWQHGQIPTTDETGVESVIIRDRLRHFEVNSRLLMELLTAPRGAPGVIRLLRLPKRVLTQAITGTPQFLFPNLVRDTLGGAVTSPSGARPLIESARGMKSYISNDPRFKAFRANGGLFSGRTNAPTEGGRQRRFAGVGPKNAWEMLGRALSGYQTIVSAAEQGTRLGEFARGIEKGANPLEAAYRGRSNTTDFAQMGRNEVWSWLLQVTPFANAGLQGINQMMTALFEGKDGRIAFSSASARKFALTAVTRFGLPLAVATALLWMLNHDDERYKRLTVDEKSRFWHVWLPGGQHIQIPKPYGVGFIFGDLPEMALDFMADKDGEQLGKQLAFSLGQHFWFMDYPGVIQPWIEHMMNRKFNGAPIVPASVEALTGDDLQYQYTDTTPQLYRLLAQKAADAHVNLSPVVLQHYAKGFLGYVEAYMADGMDWLFWDEKKFGEKPFERNVLSYFTQQFDGTKPPYRTKWTEGYYDLRARAMSKAQAYSTLFKAVGRDEAPFTRFSKSDVNLVLRQLASKFRKVDKAMSTGNAYLDGITYDPDLSRADKEAKINAYYEERDKVLGTTYREIDALVTKLEAGIQK